MQSPYLPGTSHKRIKIVNGKQTLSEGHLSVPRLRRCLCTSPIECSKRILNTPPSSGSCFYKRLYFMPYPKTVLQVWWSFSMRTELKGKNKMAVFKGLLMLMRYVLSSCSVKWLNGCGGLFLHSLKLCPKALIPTWSPENLHMAQGRTQSVV